MPEVSVIIPVYNAEKYLEQTFDSLINQTFDDYEIICVNDGSRDNSLKILEEYSKKSDKIKILNQENSGQALARHNGIKSSTSKYLMFCDSDDLYEPKMIEEMYNKINNSNYDFVMCNFKLMDVATQEIKERDNVGAYAMKYGDNSVDIEKIFNIDVCLWNKIIRKEILVQNHIEYPVKYEHDDTMFMLTYFSCCKNFFVIENPLYTYCINNSNSVMGKLNANKHTKRQFDFVFALDYLISNFSKKKLLENEYQRLTSFILGFSTFYYMQLHKENRKPAYRHFKAFIFKNRAFLSKNEIFNKILKTKFLFEFDKILIQDKKNNNFIQTVFSIKNCYRMGERYKIITILGLEIPYKNPKKDNLN